MIKLICHFKRKPGLTLQQFKQRYEEGHIPLMIELCPPTVIKYRRNYRMEGGGFDPFGEGVDSEPDYDVITEVWYASRETLEETIAFISRPEIAALIVEDEEQFMDRSATRFMLFEEVTTDPADLAKMNWDLPSR